MILRGGLWKRTSLVEGARARKFAVSLVAGRFFTPRSAGVGLAMAAPQLLDGQHLWYPPTLVSPDASRVLEGAFGGSFLSGGQIHETGIED